jgi:hypothetical protein
MSDVITGHKSQFWLANASGTLTKIAEVTDVPLPSGAKDLIEVSHMETEDYKDFITAPLRDGEEADIVMNYIPGSASDVLLQEAWDSGARREYRISIPVDEAGTTRREFTGDCIVRNYVRENPMEDRRTATLTIKWVGPITETEV